MLADLLGFAGDLLRACGDLWGIPCGLAGGLLRACGASLRGSVNVKAQGLGNTWGTTDGAPPKGANVRSYRWGSQCGATPPSFLDSCPTELDINIGFALPVEAFFAKLDPL